MSNVWGHLLKGVAPVVPKEDPVPRAANREAVWAYLRANQPCTLASMLAGLPGVDALSVSAIVGNGARCGRIQFEFRKVPGIHRKVKFYSEVL